MKGFTMSVQQLRKDKALLNIINQMMIDECISYRRAEKKLLITLNQGDSND